ncbi:MAG: transcription antitermination factor NusB [Aureliella sp.]
MTTRRRAREIVLQLLYEEDLHPEQNAKVADQFLTKRLHGNRPLVEFARKLFHNVVANRKELDKALSSKAANWSLRRMAAIDRNVLRLGAYEILMTDTPGRVVINEAVELAKRYGDRQSGQFVNGILDRVLHQTASSLTDMDPPHDGSSIAEPATGPVAENQVVNRQVSDESTSISPAIHQPARSDAPPPKVNYGRFQTT